MTVRWRLSPYYVDGRVYFVLGRGTDLRVRIYRVGREDIHPAVQPRGYKRWITRLFRECHCYHFGLFELLIITNTFGTFRHRLFRHQSLHR